MKESMANETLIPVKEALARILADFKPLGTEPVDIFHANNRVLAENIRARFDLPPFDNSSMDGFALHPLDRPNTAQNRAVTLQVVADIPAGVTPSVVLQPGQAARIMTGAPLPKNADCVIPVEDTNFPHRNHGELPEQIIIQQFPAPGENIRPHGQDAKENEVILQPGRRLTPPDLALLASFGLSTVKAFRQPRVAILSTGNELIKPGNSLEPGKIFESNSPMVGNLAAQAGAIPVYLGIAEDDPTVIKQKLDQALEAKADLILTSAGVSVGVYDYVRTVIEANGKLDLWRINMRPGKPLAYGHYRSLPVIGLPGNPVAAFVGSLVFVIPVIQRLSGSSVEPRRLMRGQLAHEVRSDGRESYLRAVAAPTGAGWAVSLNSHQGSGNLLSIVRANALIIIPSGVKSLPAGSEVDLWLLNQESTGGN